MGYAGKWTNVARSVVVLAVIALMAAACGSDPTPTPRPTPTPTAMAEPTPTVSAEAMFQDEWDALAAAAAEEGKLIVAGGTSGSRDNRPVWDVFSEKYGIEVIVSGGANQDTTDRILAEQSAGALRRRHHHGRPAPGQPDPRRRRTPADGAAVHPP